MKATIIFISFIFFLAFALQVSAQEIQFSNELKGFEFYNQGKLKDIKLKTSTDEDVKAVFGKDCLGGGCEYNENWEIGFLYYFGWMKRYETENGVKKTYIVSPEFVDRIFAIILVPQKMISLNQISFSKEFQSESSFGEHGVKLKYYAGSNGLYYSLLDEDDSYKGNLTHIIYRIPDNLEQDMFILTQIQDKPFSN